GRAVSRMQARGDAGGLAAVHHIGTATTVAVKVDEARNDQAIGRRVAADDRADPDSVQRERALHPAIRRENATAEMRHGPWSCPPADGGRMRKFCIIPVSSWGRM